MYLIVNESKTASVPVIFKKYLIIDETSCLLHYSTSWAFKTTRCYQRNFCRREPSTPVFKNPTITSKQLACQTCHFSVKCKCLF